MAAIDKALLHGRWLHAHEEDASDESVFRPASYPMPPARGRTGYEFLSDGTVVVIGPGPTDRTVKRDGTWSIDANKQLTIRLPGHADQVLEISTLDPDRLVVKKAMCTKGDLR